MNELILPICVGSKGMKRRKDKSYNFRLNVLVCCGADYWDWEKWFGEEEK